MWTIHDRTARGIAHALQTVIEAGRLAPGERLPTARALAQDLKVAVGTVHRAFRLAQRRGLIRSRVGDGSFVQVRPQTALLDLAANTGLPLTPAELDELAADFAGIAQGGGFNALARSVNTLDEPRFREAGQRWLAQIGWHAPLERLRPVASMQHGLVAIFAALARPGSVVCCEPLTYGGVREAAGLLGLKLAPVAMDGFGIQPDAFEEVCARLRPRLLYTIPTAHAPTGATLPLERRLAIAAMARRHAVWIVEEDAETHLLDDAPPAFGQLAPDRTFSVIDVHKTLLTGAQAGWCVLPAGLPDVPRIDNALLSMIGFIQPLWFELLDRMIRDGRAAAGIERRRARLRERHDTLTAALGPPRRWRLRSDPRTHTAWLELPLKWRAAAFAEQCRTRGVRVTPAEAFAVEHAAAPQCLRLSLSGVEQLQDLAAGAALVRKLLDDGPGARPAA